MPLSAAMALSGLNEDQFGKELKHLYGYGARLLKPLNSALSNAYNLSSSQNLSMEQRSNSMESGIASLPSSRSSTDTYWDFLRQLDRVKVSDINILCY
ncbi:hypothetical protein HHI36_004754 [Cryptolaemus montrouzieri]|uniref:Uncharacterized protein n=1 Tax=Cryptolaemus montrouzieri TaxID=559131 RepID=A0ABD2NT26_9CUCU